jgi:hypothetical protein
MLQAGYVVGRKAARAGTFGCILKAEEMVNLCLLSVGVGVAVCLFA